MSTISKLPAHSIYLHIPFCRKRCSYCDFNTYAGIETLLPAYVEALCQEIVKVTSANRCKYPVHTIFLGGGTPSLLTPVQLETILQTIDACFSLAENAEISIEANPGTIVDQSLNAYSALGVNRISFGMQSSREGELKLLGRIHTHADTVNSIEIARRAGFNNLNLDLIYNLPGQTMRNWQENLQAALDLSPEHISLYALGIEEGTLLHQQIDEGFLPYPDDDQAADMVQYAVEMLGQMGYQHYEISNWAKNDPERDYRCRHNLQYWQNDPYFGFGAGAHGLVENVRTVNEPHPNNYIAACLQNQPTEFPLGPATIESRKRSRMEQIEEHMILNLRLLQQGVERKEFLDRFGAELMAIYPQVIPELIQNKRLEWIHQEQALRLNPKDFFIANQILVNFLFDEDQ